MDTKWERDPGFVLYDFNRPEDIPAELHGTFAMVVIDPPFIIKDVWEKYTKVSGLLAILYAPECSTTLTTYAHNAACAACTGGAAAAEAWRASASKHYS
jgi:Probable N6-adenine methyltransferase